MNYTEMERHESAKWGICSRFQHWDRVSLDSETGKKRIVWRETHEFDSEYQSEVYVY